VRVVRSRVVNYILNCWMMGLFVSMNLDGLAGDE
jgi:hypothetical protein